MLVSPYVVPVETVIVSVLLELSSQPAALNVNKAEVTPLLRLIVGVVHHPSAEEEPSFTHLQA